MPDVRAIRERAEACPQEEWRPAWSQSSGDASAVLCGKPPTAVILCDNPKQAAHIAGMDPPTTLALLNELERLQTRVRQEFELAEGLRFTTMNETCRADEAEAALAERDARIAGLVAALELWQSYGCPICHGDCASANPPVYGCPVVASIDALRGARRAALSPEYPDGLDMQEKW